MIFIGIDALPHEGRVYVQQNILAATFEYPTGGDKAIEVALDLLKGKTVPKEIVLPSKVFTRVTVRNGGEVLK